MTYPILMIHPKCTPEHLGYLPMIFLPEDERPAIEQANERYAHGGGWHTIEGFAFDKTDCSLSYPGDPTFKPIAAMWLPHTEETILLYDHSMVCIVRKDGSFDAGRMD